MILLCTLLSQYEVTFDNQLIDRDEKTPKYDEIVTTLQGKAIKDAIGTIIRGITSKNFQNT